MQPRSSEPNRPPTTKIYLESRYQKLERGLPQTVFFCPDCKGHFRRRRKCERCAGFGKLTKDSVQELLGRVILPAFRAKTGKFHGAGREDIDVLMLGTGRPFVFEVVAPRVLDVDLAELRQQIHDRYGDRIRIEPFVDVPKKRVAYWKESKFDKSYRLLVEAEQDVVVERAEGLRGARVELIQRTPQRVAHRRADLERQRSLVVQAVQIVGPRSLQVEICCAHGTYVKEWVSGDDGRTQPSLADALGTACTCRQLDVTGILTDSADGSASPSLSPA